MRRRRQRLADRRRSVGLTQEDLAEKLGVDRSTVVRWETGTASPQPWMRPRLADALLITLEELVDVLANEAERDNRAPAAQGAVSPDRATAYPATATDLRHDFDELASRYDRVPSASLLAKGGEQLSLITYMARHVPQGRAGRELLTLQADALTFMGQLVWDASQRRDHATARHYYDESLRVARHLHDPTLEAPS
ncbi:helix-turn-helix transcriptional regulator, partial [Streptomyces sp. NPDC007162]|uniref:helix-turn-helix transcriptional regulator n=1 Tax=Streptomyces sp. NPDC007162 TaxID=3156917 RepID=UPI0033EEAAEF